MFIGFKKRGIVIISAKQYKEIVDELYDQYYGGQDYYIKNVFPEYKRSLVNRYKSDVDTQYDAATYWEYSIETALDKGIANHGKLLDILRKVCNWI